jgi:hypothetical protein
MIPGVGLALREHSFPPLVHHGLRSVQRSSGLSAAVSVCTEPASETTSDLGRMAGQLALGCARTEAADRKAAQGRSPTFLFFG